MINQFQKAYKEKVEKEKIPLGKRPDWLKVKLPTGDNYTDVKTLMRKQNLHTVCEEAKCPNLAECWNQSHCNIYDFGRYMHTELWFL